MAEAEAVIFFGKERTTSAAARRVIGHALTHLIVAGTILATLSYRFAQRRQISRSAKASFCTPV